MPIPEEKAVFNWGRTKFTRNIHSPTMAESPMRIPATNVDLATRAVLDVVEA